MQARNDNVSITLLDKHAERNWNSRRPSPFPGYIDISIGALILQNDRQKRSVDLDLAVVVDET